MAHMFLPLCGSIQHDRLPPARSTHSPSSLFLPAQGMQHSRASPAPPTQKDMVGVGWAGDPVLLPPQVPQPQSRHIPAAYTGTLGSLGVLGPARTMGRKGLILWQGVSMEPGNCQPWVFCLQDWICSPCLHLSGAVVVRDMRAWRVCQAGYPISADLEVQGKLSSVSVGPAGAQCVVCWTVMAWEQDCPLAPHRTLSSIPRGSHTLAFSGCLQLHYQLPPVLGDMSQHHPHSRREEGEWGSSMAWEDGQQGLGADFYSDQTRQRTKHELGMAAAAPLPTYLQVPKVPHWNTSPAADYLHMGGMRPHGGTLWCVVVLICPFIWPHAATESFFSPMVPHPVPAYDANSQEKHNALCSCADFTSQHASKPTGWES